MMAAMGGGGKNEIDVDGVNVKGFPTIMFFSCTFASKKLQYIISLLFFLHPNAICLRSLQLTIEIELKHSYAHFDLLKKLYHLLFEHFLHDRHRRS